MMHWFPGLFSIRELQQMDVRLSAYWVRQVRVKALEQQVRMTEAARIAQAGKTSDYQRHINQLRLEIRKAELKITDREIQDRNWESIRMMASRK